MAIESGKEGDNVSNDLFKDVTYYVVGDISQKVLDLLNAGGAKHDSYLSEMVSHVIADDHTQSEYSEAKELFDLPVVTSQWVILSVKCKKQLLIKQFAPEGLPFSGVVACCSQLDPEDTRTLWGMITFHGGKCQKSLDKSCTHLITAEMEGAKYETAEKNEGGIKVVCPDWVTESIQKGEKLEEVPFHPRLIKLPTPEPTPPPTPPPPLPVIEQPPMQLPHHDPMEIHEVIAKQQAKHHAQMMKSHAQQQAKFHKEMGIGRSPAKQVIAQQLAAAVLERRGSIEEGGQGSRPPNPSAKQALARMVNSRIQGTRPGNKSPVGIPPGLHLPPQSQFPPGMLPFPHEMLQHRQNVPRTLRNITNSADPRQLGPGPTRPNKITQMLGLNLQVPPMGPRPPPPRYGLPQMPVVHQQKHPQPSLPILPPTYWGHDPSDKLPPDLCLLGCVFYVTDYLKILGQEQLDNWKKVIEQHGGQVDPAYSNRVTHLLCANQQSDVFHIALKDQRRVVTAFWLNDVLVKKKMLPPWQALHLPIIYGEDKPCQNQILCMTNFDDEERLRVKQMISAIGARYTGYMSHTNSALICNKPEGKKFEKAKDWQIPVVNVQWLSDLVLGHLDALKIPVHQKFLLYNQPDQFHLDAMKVAHLMVGWLVQLKIQKETWKKFLPLQKSKLLPAPGQENMMSKQPDLNEPAKKRQRLEMEEIGISNNVYPRVLFTGFPKGLAKSLQMMVIKLNGMVTESPKQCTHLVTPTLSRTMKFFIAINICKFVVTKEWLENSIAQNKFIDETPFALKDTKSENEMQCNLQESLKRAQIKPLFEGLTFYISPSVTPPPYDLAKIIESASGKVVRARQSSRAFTSQKDENGNSKHIMITCENDIHLFRDLIAKKIPVHNAEFVLTGVMRQTVDFKSFQIDVH